MRLFDDSSSAGWIVVVDWERFQHYGDRKPVWIKTYLDLLSCDDYLDLTPSARSVLHGVWLLTANTRGAVRGDTRKLSRALSMKVTSAHLDALIRAGFIEIVASKPLARSEQPASPHARPRARAEAEAEEDVEEEQGSTRSETTAHAGVQPNGLPVHQELLIGKLVAAIGAHADEGTVGVVRSYAARLSEGSLVRVLESVSLAQPKNRAAYVVAGLKGELEGGEKPFEGDEPS